MCQSTGGNHNDLDQFTLWKGIAAHNRAMAHALRLELDPILQITPELARRAMVYLCAMALIAASPALLHAQQAAMCMVARGAPLALGV